MRGVNPADAARTLKTLLDVWDVASERMLDAVAKRLARGITEDGWAETKAREVLLVRAELRAIVEQNLAAGLERQALDALGEAYEMGADTAAVLGRPIGTNPGKVARFVARFVAQLRGTFLPVIRAHEDLYQRAIGDSEALMQTGVIVRRDAVAQAVDRLITDGADRFEVQRADGTVSRWHLDSYVRMAGRTAALQASVEGQLDGMIARGKDLVVISDSPRECEKCAPWEGKLLSITGNTSIGTEVDGHEVHGSIAEAVAAGLWHPNCTHRADPYVSGLTRIPEPKENPEGYAAAQQQRRLEREVRALKRELAAVLALGDTATARALRRKIRAKHEQLEAHAKATGQNRRRERERPVEAKQPPPQSTPVEATPVEPIVDRPVTKAAENVVKAVDLSWVSDAELDAELTRASETEDFDHLDAVVGEIERREAAAAKIPAEDSDDDERWGQLEALVGQGWDEESAVAEVFGVSAEQQRRDRAISVLRQQGYRGRGFDELARQAYRDEVYRQYIAAEDATQGHMRTKSAQQRGIGPLTLFTGPAHVARANASPELKAWWDEHGRVTFEQFVADLLGDATGSRRARFRTGGEDWLQ